MPPPLVPPPITDTGAWTCPRFLQRWLDINPVTKLDRVGSFITLPSFSQAVTWNGYSDIVASFNFEGPNNFSLKSLTTELPLNPNYCLCIMWKDTSGNVYRYALWRGVGEVFYFNVPLYTGQLIKKNFRLEIWSTDSTPAVQTTSLQLYTSVLGNLDYRYAQDFQLVNNDAENTQFNNINSAATLPVGARYNLLSTVGLVTSGGGSTYTSWTDSIGGLVFNPNGAVGVTPVDPTLNKPAVVFTAGGLTISAAGLGINPGTTIIVFNLENLGSSGTIYNNGNGTIFGFNSVTSKFTAFVGGVSYKTAIAQKWYVAILEPNTGGVYIYDLQSAEQLDIFGGSTSVGPDSTITIGTSQLGISALVVYDFQVNYDLYQQLVGYCTQQYFPILSLPLIFPLSSQPQPN